MSKQPVPINAIAAGTVAVVVEGRVVTTTPDGHDTWYSNLSEVSVAVGDEITQGQVIGYIIEPEESEQ